MQKMKTPVYPYFRATDWSVELSIATTWFEWFKSLKIPCVLTTVVKHSSRHGGKGRRNPNELFPHYAVWRLGVEACTAISHPPNDEEIEGVWLMEYTGQDGEGENAEIAG